MERVYSYNPGARAGQVLAGQLGDSPLSKLLSHNVIHLLIPEILNIIQHQYNVPN